jgi:hypothetical protein
MLTRWQAAPLLLLGTLACLMPARSYSLDPVQFVRHLLYFHELPPSMTGSSGQIPTLPADWILSAAVLAYVAAHYRLQSLIYHIFPPDPRRKTLPRLEDRQPHQFHLPFTRTGAEGAVREASLSMLANAGRRSTGQVNLEEIGMLILGLPLWAALGFLFWRWLGVIPPVLREVPGTLRPPMLLLWVVGTALALATGLFAYFRMRQASREESLLYLQDQLWMNTSRDQGRVNRFLVWARWRRQRRREKA